MTKRIGTSEAIRISAANKRSRSRGRSEDNHLEPECWPALNPKFQFASGASIFTIGSCFARNIERQMASLGFVIPTMQVDPMYHATNGSSDSNDNVVSALFNKYNPASIYQEIKWTHDILCRNGIFEESDCSNLFLENDNGKVTDLHIFPVKAASYDLAIERRQVVYNVFKQAFDSEVVIITLGLIEAWWDSDSQLYVLRLPDGELRSPSGRFLFERLTFSQCYDYVCKCIDLLDSTSRKKYLITTSPVVMQRTFTNDDVIVANMYSKSVLRAVAGQVSAERDNVDYFPSFESIILTKQYYVWKDDLMHPSEGVIHRIVGRVATAYAPSESELLPSSAPNVNEEAELFADLVLTGGTEGSALAFEAVKGDTLAIAVPRFQIAAAMLMREMSDKSRAVEHAKAALRLGRTHPRVRYELISVLEWAGEHGLAGKVSRAINTLCVAKPRMAAAISSRLARQGRLTEAIQFVEKVCEMAPGIQEFEALILQLRRKLDASKTGVGQP